MTFQKESGKEGLKILLMLASVIIITAGLQAGKPVLLPIVLSGFLAIVSYPLTTFFKSRLCFPHWLAVTFTVIMDFGILVGLGTDAYTNDMLESIKAALTIQRHNACLPGVGWCEVTDMLFKNNAKMAQRAGFPEIGVLKAGAAADVIVMDYKPFTPFSDANIDGHMLFGMTGRQCQTTMINGKILMKDRVLTGIDEEAVNAKILEVSKKLWGELNHREY